MMSDFIKSQEVMRVIEHSKKELAEALKNASIIILDEMTDDEHKEMATRRALHVS